MELRDVSLKIKNFKCFAGTPEGFDEIKPINIIIGRNNSGKSTLLDLVGHATQFANLSAQGHKGQVPETFISWILTRTFIKEYLPNKNQHLQGVKHTWNFNPQGWANDALFGKRISYTHNDNKHLKFANVEGVEFNDPHLLDQLAWIGNHLSNCTQKPFDSYTFHRIVADRDIVPEVTSNNRVIGSNGVGVTNVIQRYLNSALLDRDLIETTLLNELNAIFRPDANYQRILIEQNNDNAWEIILEELGKGRIPMSQTGSGLKTVLLVLAMLIITPVVGEKKKPLSEMLFGFEELENNLHPAIQRRLFHYLRKFANDNECRFFITTHSSVVIDMFSDDEHAQILHVTHDGNVATVRRVETESHSHSVLDDLDVRASDLLQTNAIVWVEGPSDLIYFNQWIELWSEGELIEGVHYQCLPYGGSLNAHLSFDSPELADDLIAALKINRHAILLADSDRNAEDGELKEHTVRLAEEVERVGGYAWITAGKEVENYIPKSVMRKYLDNETAGGTGVYTNVLAYIAKQKGNKTQPRKVALARDIVPLLTKESLEELPGMSEHLDEVCRRIREWNRIESSG